MPELATDCSCRLTTQQEHRLKTQARARLDIPVVWVRVEDAAALSPDPDDATGTVALLGAFGIKTGEVRLSANTSDVRQRNWLAATLWLVEALAVSLAIGSGLVLLLRG